VIAASWGYQSRTRLAKYKPDFIADKPGDIIKILKKISG